MSGGIRYYVTSYRTPQLTGREDERGTTPDHADYMTQLMLPFTEHETQAERCRRVLAAVPRLTTAGAITFDAERQREAEAKARGGMLKTSQTPGGTIRNQTSTAQIARE